MYSSETFILKCIIYFLFSLYLGIAPKVVTKNSKNMSFRVVAFGTSDSKTLHMYLWSLPMFKKRKSYKAVQKKAAAKSYINEIQKQIIRKHKIKAMPVL